MTVRAVDSERDFYELLDREARFKVEAKACYCSVLEDCWFTDFKNRAREVKSCEPLLASERW